MESNVGGDCRELAIRCGERYELWQHQRLPLERPELEHSFFDGTAGIVCFLANLYSHTGRVETSNLITRLVDRCCADLDSIPDAYTGSFYFGPSGILCAILYAKACGIQLAQTSPRTTIDQCIVRLIAHPGRLPDLIGGEAGTIPFLVAVTGLSELAHAAALEAGERLLQSATVRGEQMSWRTLANTTGDLTGFAHGTSGIAVACGELYASTKDERFLKAAHHAVNYENAQFDSVARNWPILLQNRGDDAKHPTFGWHWCHGAGGIALARMRLFEITGEPHFALDAQRALEITTESVMGAISRDSDTHSDLGLCHGLAGAGELFLFAGRRFAPQWLDVADRIAAAIVSRLDQTRWSDEPIVEERSLFAGLAGVGDFCLRFCDADADRTILLPNELLLSFARRSNSSRALASCFSDC